MFIMIAIFAIIFIGVQIILFIQFADKPIEEIPTWLIWLLFWLK